MSGFKVNFSVNNQLATPSMHAAALANRPAAGQPGRVFIDTDNPSTGIYRDTGTVWVQIAETGASDVDTLQNVTDNGNTTSNTLILTYDSLFNGSNQIEFFDVGTTAVRYSINKVGTGNRLTIQGNSPLSTFDMGIMIDAPNNTLRTYFGSSFETKGISLDFTNNIYRVGNVTGTAGQQGIYIDAIGEVGIGNTNPSYLLDVSGTTRVSGTELRLDNGTTGVINLFSTTPEIRFASADPTGYRIFRSATTMTWNSANIALQIQGNSAYTIDASNGHVWRTALSGGAALARLTTGGNFMVGTTTDAGYKLDVNGTARVSSTTANVEQALFTGSASPYIRYGIWGVIGMHTSSQATFVGNNAYPSDAGNQSWTRIGSAGSLIGWINIGETGMFFASGINAATGSSRTDSKMALFPSGNFGVGNGVTDISTAILSATSTTKGFLPPRMTTAQINAISSPAEGLIAYNTTISHLCVYQSGAWVRINHSPM